MSKFSENSNKFVKNIELCFKNYNDYVKKGKTIENICKRIDYAFLAADFICKAQQYYLKYKKESAFSTKEIIEFDHKISCYADRLYVAMDNLLNFCKLLDKRTESGRTYGYGTSFYKDFEKLTIQVLFIASRWKVERIMNVLDLPRPKEKKKLPRRLPLLKDVMPCFDRILAVKMGIRFDDGFNINKLVVCLPPSSGKTYCANVYNLLSLGHHFVYFKETGMIRMTNTATNAQDYGKAVSLMAKNYIEIPIGDLKYRFYPFLEAFPELKENITSEELTTTCKMYKTNELFIRDSTDKLLMRNCNSECTDSIFMFGIEASINGKRAQLGTIADDLSGGVDTMDNDEYHKKITDKIKSDVSDRNDDDDCPLILMGTMYNENDYQNTHIEEWEKEGLIQHPYYKNVKFTKDGKKAICLVDVEDENGNTIAPQLYTNEKLREKRDYFAKRGKEYVYSLVYKQKRESREPLTFSYQFLKTYDELPDCLQQESVAMIDTTRTSGNNYFICAFFRYNPKDKMYYFTDVLMKQKSLGTDYDPKNEFGYELCRKIAKNNTIECRVESNTSNTTTSLLKRLCNDIFYNACKFKNSYTVNNKRGGTKITRILEHEDSIKNNIVFPSLKNITNNEMFLFMRVLTNWNSKGGQNNQNPDDPPDVLSLFDQNFIHKKSSYGSIVDIPKEYLKNFF